MIAPGGPAAAAAAAPLDWLNAAEAAAGTARLDWPAAAGTALLDWLAAAGSESRGLEHAGPDGPLAVGRESRGLERAVQAPDFALRDREGATPQLKQLRVRHPGTKIARLPFRWCWQSRRMRWENERGRRLSRKPRRANAALQGGRRQKAREGQGAGGRVGRARSRRDELGTTTSCINERRDENERARCCWMGQLEGLKSAWGLGSGERRRGSMQTWCQPRMQRSGVPYRKRLARATVIRDA